uniref:Uncharacterized protein n=1 Tax=Anguilla anguilla TaxID=7936 RepID=A0A0E9R2C9_ANGAN
MQLLYSVLIVENIQQCKSVRVVKGLCAYDA